MSPQIDAARLAQITRLDEGGHNDVEAGTCAMEAVAFIAREPWSDHPKCASRVIGAFMRSWNDSLPDDERNELLLPLVPRLVGTAGSTELENRRALMAADWLVRVHTPVWLRLAMLTVQAALLEALPEITSMAQASSIRGPLEAMRKDAAAAGDAAHAAAWGIRGAAPWALTRGTAGDAARDAARAAAWGATWGAAGDAAWAAAWAASAAAAWSGAGDVLKDTKLQLQLSAVKLVERMIEAREEL